MIVEALFNLLFLPLKGLLSLIPDFDWVIDADFFTKGFEILRVGGYLLPMGTVTTVVALIVSIVLLKAFIAFIRLVWSLIPFKFT